MKVSLIYIKEIKELEKCPISDLERYIKYFKIGNIYNFEFEVNYIKAEIINRDLFSYIDYTNEFAFHKNEIDEYFMTLEQWRELRINKILENE